MQRERIGLPLVVTQDALHVLHVLDGALISSEDLRTRILRPRIPVSFEPVVEFVARNIVDERDVRNVVGRPVAIFGEERGHIEGGDVTRNLFGDPQGAFLERLSWGEQLVVDNYPLIVVSSRVIKREVGDPFRTADRQSVGDYDSDPIRNNLLWFNKISVEGEIVDVVGGLYDDEVLRGDEEVVVAGQNTGIRREGDSGGGRDGEGHIIVLVHSEQVDEVRPSGVRSEQRLTVVAEFDQRGAMLFLETWLEFVGAHLVVVLVETDERIDGDLNVVDFAVQLVHQEVFIGEGLIAGRH